MRQPQKANAALHTIRQNRTADVLTADMRRKGNQSNSIAIDQNAGTKVRRDPNGPPDVIAGMVADAVVEEVAAEADARVMTREQNVVLAAMKSRK